MRHTKSSAKRFIFSPVHDEPQLASSGTGPFAGHAPRRIGGRAVPSTMIADRYGAGYCLYSGQHSV